MKFMRVIENGLTDFHFTLGDMDTVVYPLIQIGPLKIDNDSKATAALFQYLPPLSTVYLATGYFNLTSQYADVLLNLSKSNYSIVTASPKVRFSGWILAGRINAFFRADCLYSF